MTDSQPMTSWPSTGNAYDDALFALGRAAGGVDAVVAGVTNGYGILPTLDAGQRSRLTTTVIPQLRQHIENTLKMFDEAGIGGSGGFGS